MNSIIVILNTGGHCIETSAKNEFRRLTDLLLQSDTDNIDSDLEQKIELLLHFLKNSDFNMLRSSDERLAGITPSECLVKWDNNKNSIVIFAD